MNRVKLAYYVLRYLGPRIAWLRAGVYLRKSLGITARMFPTRRWDDLGLRQLVRPGIPIGSEEYACYKREESPPFLFPLGQPPALPTSLRRFEPTRKPSLPERFNLLTEGRCVYFCRYPSPDPVDWYRNPFDGTHSDPDKPWFALPDYAPEQGDPRMLWEPARATWAYDCAKAYVEGISSEAGPTFWRWVDSWMNACPPFRGFQWKCGQESAVRLLAILFGFWSLADDPSTDSDRYIQVARLAWATGYRVFHHIRYALSQNNNHAMSEACGLLLIGQLFPEFRDAAAWQACGRRVLTQEIQRQVYADGSYVQHSMNYQRVMLQMSLLAVRLAELAGRPFPQDTYDRLSRSGHFLYQMMDPETGRLPQHGHNDGAYILPLSECDFHDFRPVIQTTHYVAHREHLLPHGPWDEDLVWIFGARAAERDSPNTPSPCSSAFEHGGYYTLRRANSWALIRSHTYRDRPGQCDQLHVDLWWRGLNVLQDCGSYLYYCPGRPDVEYYFKSVRAHNTVEIDETNPLELVSRFLWFPWPRCETRRFDPDGELPGNVETLCYDYVRRPVRCIHRRTLMALEGDLWVVVDDLIGSGSHTGVVRWHLLDAPYHVDSLHNTVTLDTRPGPCSVTVVGDPAACDRFEVIRGRDERNRVQGFASSEYGRRVPVPTVEAAWHGALPLRIISTFCPGRPVIPRRQPRDSGSHFWRLDAGNVRHVLRLSDPGDVSAATLLDYSKGTDRLPVRRDDVLS